MMTEWKKNDVIEVLIEDLGSEGEGIGHVNGFTFFVKDALIGDRITAIVTKLQKNYGYARLKEIQEPSPDRVTPRCPSASRCGGCQIQQMDYAAQLAFKQKKVEGLLKRVGGLEDVEVRPVKGMENPWNYRNKSQYPVGTDREGHVVIGFYAGRTHAIIEQKGCAISGEYCDTVISVIKKWMQTGPVKAYNEQTGKGVVRHVLIREARATGELMVCVVINSDKLPASDKLKSMLLGALPQITSLSYSVNKEKTNVILGYNFTCIYGKPYITDKIGEVSYHISPLSFYQVNPEQTKVLYEEALKAAGLTGREIVWDLYCGIGTISLFLAQKAKFVYGVEIIDAAVKNAIENAEINGFQNTKFFVGKAEEVLPREYEADPKGTRADVIVVDPPRKGCDQTLLETMVKMAPERIVYVSCDPATLARDLKFLSGNGYEVQYAQPVDMFGHSIHVETVALLNRTMQS